MSEGSSIYKMLIGTAFMALTIVIAVVGYMIAGWGLVDSMYMVVITIFGVGYGEVRPIDTPALKAFTAVIIIAGCSAGIYVVGGFVQMIAEGEIHRALGARRMSRGIQQANGHVIICGFGRVGQILAQELATLEVTFVCVDSSKERIMEAEEKGYLVVLGDAGNEETLRQAGIERARVVAPVLPDDAANVFITLTARELSEDIQIIARGESTATQRKLIRSGANHVVLPAAIGAAKIANMIACATTESLITDAKQRDRLNSSLAALGLAVREVRITANSHAAQCKVSELTFNHASGTLIAAIQSFDGTMRFNPSPDEIVKSDDTLFIISHQQSIQAAMRDMQSTKKEVLYRGAKISG